MQKWEYHTTSNQGPNDPKAARLGMACWELVSVVNLGALWYFYYKRPIKDTDS
jgi:hypothetical protein